MPERFRILGVAFIALGLACEEDHPDENGHEIPECVEYELDGCMALYPATYDQVWTQTLEVGCASRGTTCHNGASGLTFTDPQTSWNYLIDEELVVAGDPLCSHLFVRLASDDPAIRMPPGSSGLSPEALCSIGTWIADGAEYVAP